MIARNADACIKTVWLRNGVTDTVLKPENSV